MKDEEKESNQGRKVEEPYDPERTPQPPQRVEPGPENKKGEPGDDSKRSSPEPDGGKEGKEEKPHLLSDETKIDDETTI